MIKPTVSVIIPNYNHAPYLTQRIESVLSQTYQDFEVILLDDCSTDDSRSIIERYAARNERIQTVFNENNSGSPFAQWNKGITLARGEFIWIAESDDYADKYFLEELLPHLEENDFTGVVYCQSWVVDQYGTLVNNMKDWTNSLDKVRWTKDYFNRGRNECREYLYFKPTIPNASAVLFRKSVCLEIGMADEHFTMCGDWLHWIKALERTDVYFVAKSLNYFRSHSATTRVIVTHNKILNLIKEEYQILEYILSGLDSEDALRKKLLRSYFERSFNFCPVRLKFSKKFFTYVNTVAKVDTMAYPRIFLAIFKRTITYIPSIATKYLRR